MSRWPSIVTLITLVLLPSAFAQNGDGVSTKIDFVSWGDAPEGLTVKTAGKLLPIQPLPFTYSKAVSYSGSAVLEIHSANPPATVTADPANKEIPPALAERRKTDPTLAGMATLPSTSTRVTILIAPAAAGTYQLHVIDDDPAKLPPGRLRIHNFSSHLIGLRCNGKATPALVFGATAMVAPEKGRVVYELSYQKDNRWIVQENNLIRIAPDEQVQLVVLKSGNSHFISSDGTQSGYLQSVVLRRSAAAMKEAEAAADATPR